MKSSKIVSSTAKSAIRANMPLIDFWNMFVDIRRLYGDSKNVVLEIESRPGEVAWETNGKAKSLSQTEICTIANEKSTSKLIAVSSMLFKDKDLPKNEKTLPNDIYDKIHSSRKYLTNLQSKYNKNTVLPFFGQSKFKPNTSEAYYHQRMDFIAEHKDLLNIEEGEGSFSIDISTKHFGKRVTFDVNNFKFYYTEKKLKSNIEFCSQGQFLRVSAAIEVNEEISREDFIKITSQKMDFLRVKTRRNFSASKKHEISFTKVNQIFLPKNHETNNNPSKKKSTIEILHDIFTSKDFIGMEAKDRKIIQDAVLQNIELNKYRTEYEIELEQKDLSPAGPEEDEHSRIDEFISASYTVFYSSPQQKKTDSVDSKQPTETDSNLIKRQSPLAHSREEELMIEENKDETK